MKKTQRIGGIVSLAMAVTMASQSVFAHTRLEVPTVTEGSRTYNNIVIGHACGSTPVAGTSVVFPDGVTSTITVDGEAHDGALTDFVSNWGPSISVVQSNALFADGGVKKSPEGNTVGFWAAGGNVLSPDMVGMVPFRVNSVNFAANSCATSVRFTVSVVDVCTLTDIDNLQTADSGDHGDHGADKPVGLWTPNNLGTPYDAADAGAPASLTVTRDLEANPLPSSCGEGVSVVVNPSAEQMMRDMPVFVGGEQLWPLP